ncbi:hypothetical protein ADJ73_07600 [Arsenicicoccus sp. oral taxon 190]|nr:hypothetical protein ADJ73_07600 [Arsenicicoccus sp. oral taxon 190]
MSLVTVIGHVFVGGPQVVKPLLASAELPEQTRGMAYFCWHVTTVVVLALSAGFALAALDPRHSDLAWFLSVVSALVWMVSLGVTVVGGLPLRRNPAVFLFGLIALLGAASQTL